MINKKRSHVDPCGPLCTVRNTQLFSVKVCGLPDILSPPQNLSLEVGDRASFLCTVDMSCLVSYVEWYRHNNNGKPCKW